MIREDIAVALFNRVSTVAEFVTKSRRLRHIEDCAQTELPAIFQVTGDENWDASRPMVPTKKVLNFELWIYVGEPNPAGAPSMKLNPILDKLDTLFGQNGSELEVETLGGLVFNAKINGTIEIIEGVLGDKAMAIVPVRLVKADKIATTPSVIVND